MDYSNFIWSTASFIETRLREPIVYSELEETVGFTYRHIRETFKEHTGVTLSRYILIRRIANSAFDIVHTTKSLTEIASDYMFESYDTFTRAFKRYTNHLPSDFRNHLMLAKVGRKRILVGMYGPVIINIEGISNSKKKNCLSVSPCEPQLSEGKDSMNQIEKTKDSCILYGVPKVSYSIEGATPFCVSLRACLNYMGQQIDYDYIMAASGAAFRLRWNTACWDGGNVDIANIYEDRYEAYRRAFEATGRSVTILKRENSNKKEFIRFIKSEIDEGRPVIALGIIGPPEACLITGYRNEGATLLGWNCFQENQEFAKNVSTDATGYYITDSWWENECTEAVMSVGEKQEQLRSYKEILTSALELLTKQSITYYGKEHKVTAEYAGGQLAYEFWAKCVADDKEFPKNAILPILFERVVCQIDAQDMVGEGRNCAAGFLEQIGKDNESIAELCKQAANYFRKAAECAFKMNECKGGFLQDETVIRKFVEPETRKQIVQLINQAKVYESKAGELLQIIIAKL